MWYLGIDTSNYTTSAALYNSETDEVVSVKRLLPVSPGEAGLRQSDAVFAHVKQLPAVMDELFSRRDVRPAAVCASAFPRRTEGSYMPAFLVGNGTASVAARALGVKKFECSHQEGHVVAALHSAGVMEWMKEEFFAFHVSGGTTECLLVKPEGDFFRTELIAKTLDLNAGQLIDRAGVLLSLPFPCGMRMDELSRESDQIFRPKPAFHGLDCHFSGAQNQCEELLRNGAEPEDAARFVIEYVFAAIDKMTALVMERYGEKKLLYAGGVMSNSLIRERLTEKYGGHFASPEFSSDNASGPAIIAAGMDR